MPIQIVRDDITHMQVDAIVNTTNKILRASGGVDGAIHKAAGSQLQAECLSLGGCDVGAAVITRGYNLPCRYVIHTVSPKWQDGNHNEKQLLISCYKKSLEIAVQRGCTSIAFPTIGTGEHRYPRDVALRIAVETINNFLSNSIEGNNLTVYLVTFSAESYEVGSKLIAEMYRKTPLCPKHKIPVMLGNTTINVAGTEYHLCIATCQNCTVKYVNQQIMGCAKITVSGQKYEYLPGLPESSGTQHYHTTYSTSSANEKKPKGMEDIEAFFLKAEKNIQQQDERDSLKKQNEDLQQQLIVVRNKLSISEQQIILLKEKQKTELEQAIGALQQKQKAKIDETIAEYQARITRLNKLHQEAIGEIQQALDVERRRTATLQHNNASLTNQVATLTKQLAAVKLPQRQVIFVDEKLYVCGGIIRCEKYSHQREDVTGIIDTISGKPITMTVCHCKDCKLYYVKDAVFESYRDKYGTLLGQFIRKADGMSLGQHSNYGELAPESILHMNGYNVSQTHNLSPEERRKILMYVLESRIMDKHDIRNHLSYLIKMNHGNPTKDVAVSRWSSDIKWVNDYHSGMQDIVWLTGTAMYKHKRSR